jgi:dolichol-phosphate mannosyltransferase
MLAEIYYNAAMTRPLIFIPTYNERENVEVICADILAQKIECDILFMDDASPDGTGVILDGLARRHANVRVIHREGKEGIGSAHQAGIRWAYEQGYKILITMDSDQTHPPRYLPDLLAASKSAQVVVGSRHLREDSLKDWDFLRLILTHISHALTNVLLRMPHDATTAYRLYKLDEIPKEVFGLARSKGYSFFFESLYLLQTNSIVIKDVPVVLPARTRGNSKMALRDAARSAGQLMYLFAVQCLAPGRLRIP